MNPATSRSIYALCAGVRGTQTVSLQTPQRTNTLDHVQLLAREKFHKMPQKEEEGKGVVNAALRTQRMLPGRCYWV